MNISIGENIKNMRRKCGFTQEELAIRLGVTPQAVSKWENGNGTPDISQLVPISQIFGITTDSLLGVIYATYGEAHTEAALGHEKLIFLSTTLSAPEKHLAAYSYFRAESEKEPTNYTIMRKCINHGAEISRYADFNGYLSDKPEFRDEIFADCERKNLCISRYCEDKNNIEKSDNAMIWIYLHTKEFDKAKRLIDKLPSLESNNLKETIMKKYIGFKFGFDKEKDYIHENFGKLLKVTGKEFFFSLETYAWFCDHLEAIEVGKKMLGVINAYKAFDEFKGIASDIENKIRLFLPKCYCKANDINKAAEEILMMAKNYIIMAPAKACYESVEIAKDDAIKVLNNAVNLVDEEKYRNDLINHPLYKEALSIIDNI